MKVRVNGQPTEIPQRFSGNLLTFLREELGLRSTKDGCSGQGVCGCCSVLLNGRATQSCIIPIERLVEGDEVMTLEGFSDQERHIFAQSFVSKGGVQCGFCTPGFVVAGKGLLDQKPNPTRGEIRKSMRGNLCRCTGYKKIIDSVSHAAEVLRGERELESPESKKEFGGVGDRVHKYDSYRTALGDRPFVADLDVDGMCFGALKFTDHPCAKVSRIQIEKATSSNAVLAVYTAEDIPGEKLVGLLDHDWPVMVGEGEQTNYIGDVLAVVIASNRSAAREAVNLIEVDYDVLEPISSVDQALGQNSRSVHPGKSNVMSRSSVNRGDVDAAFGDSTYVAKATYETQCIEHGFLEPEACLAMPEGDGLKVYSPGQGVYEDCRQISEMLNLRREQINVELVPNGGGFGGKEDMSVQGHAALAAYLLQKPVQIVLTREESMRMHPKKHPMRLEYRLGCDAEGKLTALEARILADSGAYASVGSKVVERAVGHSTGAYCVPNVKVEGLAIYTNNIPNGAMRGFGANQATFAMDSAVEELCVQGGFDPFEFRMANALRNGDRTATGQRIQAGAGVQACLQALEPYLKRAAQEGKAFGLACGLKNTGIGNGGPDESRVKIEVHGNGRLTVHHGWTEMGQGVFTVCQQVVSEVLKLNPSFIDVKVDTRYSSPAGMTTASRATALVGNSLLDAARKLKHALRDASHQDLKGKFFEGYWRCEDTDPPESESKNPYTHFAYSYAAQCVILDPDGAIEQVVAAHDAGKIINPTLFEGQIEGSVHMGLGYAIREEFLQDQSMPKTTKFGKCGILRSTETPPIKVIGVEVPDPVGPFGAKGVGEIGLVPTAGAVGNALFHFDGERRTKLPFKTRFLLKRKVTSSSN